jgi:hypothetical protein
MLRQLFCSTLLIAACGPLLAQTEKTITIRVLDGRTGSAVTPDNIQVRLKSQQSIHADWIKQNDDGTTKMKVPEGATAISLRATYENSMSLYVNCDVARQKDTAVESWYPIADILSSGIKTPDECVKDKDADKINVEAKPGELVLFVRKKSWREGAQD